jgi:Domain of unknown function (DUF397)
VPACLLVLKLSNYVKYVLDCIPWLHIQDNIHNQWGSNVGRPTLGSPPGRPGPASYWVKSSLSFSNGNCVEVASLADGEIGVRNSRDAEGAVLRFTPDEWHAFLGGVRNGEFDSFGRK